MSTTSATLSAQSRPSLPTILIAVVSAILSLAGMALVLIGLLNLHRTGGYLLILIGLLLAVAGTVWAVRSVRTVTGASIGQQFLVVNAVLIFAFFYLPILALITFSLTLCYR